MKALKYVIVEKDDDGSNPRVVGYEFEDVKREKPVSSPDFKTNLNNVLAVKELLQDPIEEFEVDAEKARLRIEHQTLLGRVLTKKYGRVVR
jgi:hypothetical protein